MPKKNEKQQRWPQKSPGLCPMDFFIIGCGPCQCPKHKKNVKRIDDLAAKKSKEEYYDFVMELKIREMC